MEKRILGKTGIEVTELCFGALPYGPLQKNLDVEEAFYVTAHALINGINFIDTAQVYETYEPIRLAIKQTDIRPVIASKSNASSYENMENAVYEALEKMDVDYIDIFHLHAARAETDVFEKSAGALLCLKDLKKKGIIKAVGISTHNPAVVKAAAFREDIDVVFSIINKYGKGIYKGTKEEMLQAIEICVKNQKGLYLMKALGGGNLVNEYKECVDYVRNIEGYASIALGMVSKDEVEYNVGYFNGITDDDKLPMINRESKYYEVSEPLCASCGKCILACHSEAIKIRENGKARIDLDKCVTCGYCTKECAYLAIRYF